MWGVRLMQTEQFLAEGIIGSVQFEGWGPNSGQAQIVINRYSKDEARFLMAVSNSVDGQLMLFETALNAMWSAQTVQVSFVKTQNLPVVTRIDPI
jgi:hypothetical protein